MRLLTVGHGSRRADEFAEVLLEAGVGRLVDVRRYPGSRRHPHFGKDALADDLAGRGVAYEWWGEALGGRRRGRQDSRHVGWTHEAFRAYADHMESAEFRAALVSLLESLRDETPVAVMCAETQWRSCHRRLIADAAALRGVEVVHLVREGQREAHVPHPALRADDDGWPVYDAGAARLT